MGKFLNLEAINLKERALKLILFLVMKRTCHIFSKSFCIHIVQNDAIFEQPTNGFDSTGSKDGGVYL